MWCDSGVKKKPDISSYFYLYFVSFVVMPGSIEEDIRWASFAPGFLQIEHALEVARSHFSILDDAVFHGLPAAFCDYIHEKL